VALGTVADVVPLDAQQPHPGGAGPARIRSGRMPAGHRGPALASPVASRRAPPASTFGFAIGPRLNAAGRLADMALGIECLITDDPARAAEHRRSSSTPSTASGATSRPACARTPSSLLARLDPGSRASADAVRPGLAPGRGRHPRRARRRTSCTARPSPSRPALTAELKASGRSIPGLHLRDALDLVAKRHPDLLLRFGGHAAAAGLTLRDADLPRFEAAFEQVCGELLSPGGTLAHPGDRRRARNPATTRSMPCA
jgi:single-stranded-DNA-specific exonuclease